MSGYIYNDEDNAPMNDDPFDGPHNPTVYNYREEMKYYESGQYERDLEAREASVRKRHEDAIKSVMDQLGLEGKCRKCDWIQDLADGFLTDDDKMFSSQFDYLKSLCSSCDHGKHIDRVERYWNDMCDFTKGFDMRFSCNWCHVPYEVYGQHKDPDDDWKDIESRCIDCRYFQEHEELPFAEKLTEMEKEREENENESI